MFDYFDRLYESTDFMPHGDCLIWNTSLLLQHAGSDMITGISYYLIAAILFYFIFKRRDVPFFWVFLLFGAFILSCGTTHFMAAWTIYYPSYWTEGILKTINAVISFGTAIVLLPLMPKLLELPNLKGALDKVAQLNTELNQEVNNLQDEIHRREHAEKSLAMSENRFKQLIKLAPLPLAIVDSEGVIQIVNDRFIQVFGYTNKEIPTLNEWWQRAYPDKVYREWVVETWSKAVEKAQIKNTDIEPCEYKVTCHDGKERNVLISGSIIENSFLATFLDITEQKRALEAKKNIELRLNQAQKMEAIGTLAGGIAHDFNNILSAILGYSEMAREDSPSGSAVANDLDKVLIAGNRAKGLVRQILAFSRQGEAECVPLQPAILVKEAIKMLRPSLPTTIAINQNLDSQTGLIFADPTQINQILMNLCTNAFHAMEETGGTLDISLKETDLSTEDLVHEPSVEAGTFVQLSVCDSGLGIAPDIKSKIFNPYFTTKETGKGTGMGLSIVHGIVRSYGGFIKVYSELGEGTAFHVFLPVIEQEALPENIVVEPIPIGKESILFIDDEEILTEMGKDMLERLGYHVTVRNNSLEALETFQNQPDQFDLIITDQTMPGMTGTDLARRILQIKPSMPIILCTGYSTIISDEKVKAMGIREFALKPLAKKEIATLVRKVLDAS